jgi:predicted metal-dependent peptidase
MIAEANEYAMGQAGPPGNIAGQCAALLKALKPQENWENQVKKFFGMTGGLILSTSMWRKNKYGGTPKVMLRPTKRIVIFIDSSGSVYDHWISRFLGVVEEISKFAEVYLMWIDCKVQSFDKFEKAPRSAEGYQVKGRGGTSMRAGFRYLTEIKFQYDAAIVCSDLEFYDGYPTREELGNHKVLWVGIKGTPASHPVPPEAGAAIYIPEGELLKSA